MPEELNKKGPLLNTSNFIFLSNNIKVFQSSKKQLKLFQFFRKNISPKGVLFLKETRSSRSHRKNMER